MGGKVLKIQVGEEHIAQARMVRYACNLLLQDTSCPIAQALIDAGYTDVSVALYSTSASGVQYRNMSSARSVIGQWDSGAGLEPGSVIELELFS